MRASSDSVRTRMGFAMRYVRSTPSKCATRTWASTRPMTAVASSSAALSVSISSRSLGEARELVGLVLGRKRGRELGEVAVHDLLDLVEREVDPMVGDAALRKIIGADAIGAVARADEVLASRGLLVGLLLDLLRLDTRREHAPRLLAVLVLAP